MNDQPHVGTSTIGELARRSGLAVSAIRYYEEVGLIPQALRRPSGHRVYGQAAEQALAVVRRFRELGFSVDETRMLIALSADAGRSCSETRGLAQAQLETVQGKLAQLRGLERSLAALVSSCDAQCVGGPAPECTIVQDLVQIAPPAPPAAPASRCCG